MKILMWILFFSFPFLTYATDVLKRVDIAYTKGDYKEAKKLLKSAANNGNIEAQYTLGYMYENAKKWGMVEWIRPVINIMMSGVAETVDYQLDQIYDAVDCKDQYLRIMPELNNASAEGETRAKQPKGKPR